ncbi:MAG: hypothetical protein U0Z17_00070 [Bacteroidales bacterium]
MAFRCMVRCLRLKEDDGTIFVVQVSGDSGVGKSEMLAAMMLKWLKKGFTWHTLH